MLSALAATVFGRQAMAVSNLPWRNWSGGQIAHPAGRFAPANEDELIAYMRATKGTIRAVGAGHSFTPIVPTEGELIIVDRIAGLMSSNPDTLEATFGAGTRLADMGAPLGKIGQGMFNLPDIDRQTLAGATSTATHGTGVRFTTLSAYITGLRMVTPTGEVIDTSVDDDEEFMNAARVALGSLGILTRIRMQNRTMYHLKERDWVQPTEEVLKTFDEQAASHRHFEMFPLTHSDYALVQAIDETDEPVNNPPPDPEQEAAFGEAMRSWMEIPPGQRRPYINGLAEQIEPTETVDISYKILANIRNDRFNEMEYSVPLESGPACLREILDTIAEQGLDVVFPLEYRYISGDELHLSMFEGGPRAAISVHRTWDRDWHPYFSVIEPVFWKYGGRPHWGKLHTLSYEELRKLYPGLDKFRELRARLDPDRRLVNDYIGKVLAV